MKKVTSLVITVLAICMIAGCGGSGTTDTSGTNQNTSAATAYNKSFAALTNFTMSLFDVVGAFGGAVVPKTLDSKSLAEKEAGGAVLSWNCVVTATGYSCTANGETGTCTVTVEETVPDSEAVLDINCDNFTYVFEGENVTMDGIISETVNMIANSDSMDVTIAVDTGSEGFTIIMSGEQFVYGSDFMLLIEMNIQISEGSTSTITLRFTATGTVNGETLDYDETITCTYSETSTSCNY